jgi:hypothetical protein
MLLDQHVDRGRRRVRVFLLEEPDGAGVLLTSKDELRFLFALRHLLPDRHGDRQHDGHDAERHEQNSHCVAVFGLTA